MVPTHSGATAPVRAQGPARYSVLEQGLQQQAPKRKLVTWGGGVRRGGETGGPNSPGTRELGRVGCEWQGRITSRGLDPSGRSYPHSSRTLPSGSLQSLARPPPPPRATGAEFTKRMGCKSAHLGRPRGLSGPRGWGGLPPPGTPLTRGAGDPLAPRPQL